MVLLNDCGPRRGLGMSNIFTTATLTKNLFRHVVCLETYMYPGPLDSLYAGAVEEIGWFTLTVETLR